MMITMVLQPHDVMMVESEGNEFAWVFF